MKRKFSLSSLRLVSAFDSVTSLTPLDNTVTPLSPVMGERPMILDARQNVVLIPCQKGPVSEESSPADASDCPPYSPTASETERQVLSTHVIDQLQRSCAVIVQQTSPPGHDLHDDLPDHNETLRRLNEEYERTQMPAAARLPSAPRPASVAVRPPRVEIPKSSRESSIPYVHLAQNAATSFEFPSRSRQPSSADKYDKGRGEHTEYASPGTGPTAHHVLSDHLSKIRTAECNLPKASASAGPSADSSAATSRSTTTYGGIAQATSTALTSLATTPADPKRASGNNGQTLQDGPSSPLADASAKAWMTHELSRHRAEDENGRTTRPDIRSSFQKKQMEPERPASRVGAIPDAVKDHIRPRHSTDAMYPDCDLPRAGSRNGGDSKGGRDNFWRNSGLMRIDTPTSFISPELPHQDDDGPSGPDGGPNLNRPLPPLPALDQYREKERKAGPVHIAQLMRSTREERTRKLASKVQYDSVDGDYVVATKPFTDLDQMRRNAIRTGAESGSYLSHHHHHRPHRSLTPPTAVNLPPHQMRRSAILTGAESESYSSHHHPRYPHRSLTPPTAVNLPPLKKQDKTSRHSPQGSGQRVYRPSHDPIAASPPHQKHSVPPPAPPSSSRSKFPQVVPMRAGPDPSAHSAPSPSVRFTPAPTRGDPTPAGVSSLQRKPTPIPSKKQGLRKRLSRFWKQGADKGMESGNGESRMVVAN